jgi:hypothetical protein
MIKVSHFPTMTPTFLSRFEKGWGAAWGRVQRMTVAQANEHKHCAADEAPLLTHVISLKYGKTGISSIALTPTWKIPGYVEDKAETMFIRPNRQEAVERSEALCAVYRLHVKHTLRARHSEPLRVFRDVTDADLHAAVHSAMLAAIASDMSDAGIALFVKAGIVRDFGKFELKMRETESAHAKMDRLALQGVSA